MEEKQGRNMKSQSARAVSLSAFDEYHEIPYFRNVPKDGRIIFLNPLFNHEKNDWVVLVQTKPDKLQRLMGAEPIVSCYLGFQPADPKRDFEFNLGTFVIQHLSFQGVTGSLFALENDAHNCSAILEKYLLISNRDKNQRDGLNLLLRTELEYLIVVIRSFYDLLQRLSKNAASLVREVDEPRKRVIQELPDSFADVVLQSDQPRTVEQIQEKFKLPILLARFYASEAEHFKWLRELRVAIEHHGDTPPLIFDVDDGAAVDIKEYPWNGISIWNEPEFIRNERLGSLHLVFVFLINQAMEMTSRYVQAFSESIPLPPAIESGIKVYVRNQYSHHLVNLKETMKLPWERFNS
jgi:hypothetical protein